MHTNRIVLSLATCIIASWFFAACVPSERPENMRCGYTNPTFGSAECKDYDGDGWTLNSATADCQGVLPGVEGVLEEAACDYTDTVGYCVTDAGGSQQAATWAFDVDAASAESECGQAQGVWHLAMSCAFPFPFGGNFCKEYPGSDWDETSATADCQDPMGGMSLTTEFTTTMCAQGAIGKCTAESDTPQETAYWIYGDESMAGQAKNACEGFLDGIWEGSDGEVEPIGALMPEALQALASDAQVTVTPTCLDDTCLDGMIESNSFFTFEPAGAPPAVGIVLYPGGRVDPRAYAPIARDIALQGYLVAIVPMPSYMAYNGIDRADLVKEQFPAVDHWFIGGHSLGAAMAGRYAYQTGGVSGLVIWASYISSDDDISHTDMPVITIYGSEEELATDPVFEDSKAFLPADAEFYEVENGTHCQFGYYGNPKEEVITLTWDQQRAVILQETISFMQSAIVRTEARNARYDQAVAMDEQLCPLAQRTLTGLTEDLLPADQLITEWHSESDFGGSKATIINDPENELTIHGYIHPHPDAGRWAPESHAWDAWCKMRRHDRIEAAFGIDLPGEGECRDLNEQTLAWALDQLGTAERDRYENDGGMQLVFGEDVLAEAGPGFLAQDTIMTADNAQDECTLQAPALSIPVNEDTLDDPLDLYGVHYCKFLSHTQALYWVTVQSFQSDACSVPEEDPVDDGCYDPDLTLAGTCIFYFAPANMTFCSEYRGTGYDEATALTECNRWTSDPDAFATVSCADRSAETSLIGDGVHKSTCAISCGEQQDAWLLYEDPPAGMNMENYCPEGYFIVE